MKTPMLNCVDGSQEGVSIYGAAAGLIRNIDENEAQINGEFSRGESRILVSSDMLRDGQLQDHLFVGLDEDPENVGMTIFSPALREDSYLARKQEYLRNVESFVGLQRGMLSDANTQDRTATEISSSAGDFNLTVIQFQQMWQECLQDTVKLCAQLAEMYGLPQIMDTQVSVDWGNGVLYDEEKKWAEYLQMVEEGLLRPEIALGWRFGLPAKTPEEWEAIRKDWMPEQ
jgi:A118 family predicted phage portal protein